MTITDFRGKTLVSMREYYKKDGKELPTSKGINLRLLITYKILCLSDSFCFSKLVEIEIIISL